MQIHVGRGSQQLGTFTVQEINDGLATGRFQSNDLAWHEGLTDWQPLNSLAALKPAAPPPITNNPPPVPQPIFQARPAPQPVLQGQKTSALAGWSLGLGIASFLCSLLTAIPAIICGHMALGRIKRSNGVQTGRGMAIAGLVMGYLWVAMIPFMAAMMIPIVNGVSQKAQEVRNTAIAQAIISACKLYASTHDNQYPPDLKTLLEEQLIEGDQELRSILLNDELQKGYVYYGKGVTLSDAPDKVILISKASGIGGKRVVGFNDGSVQVMAMPAELPPAK